MSQDSSSNVRLLIFFKSDLSILFICGSVSRSEKCTFLFNNVLLVSFSLLFYCLNMLMVDNLGGSSPNICTTLFPIHCCMKCWNVSVNVSSEYLAKISNINLFIERTESFQPNRSKKRIMCPSMSRKIKKEQIEKCH